MRQEENRAFRKDLEEASTSKAQLSEQLADARAEAASWQHQLTAAEEKLDSLKERFKHERAQKQAVELDSEVCSFAHGQSQWCLGKAWLHLCLSLSFCVNTH